MLKEVRFHTYGFFFTGGRTPPTMIVVTPCGVMSLKHESAFVGSSSGLLLVVFNFCFILLMIAQSSYFSRISQSYRIDGPI